jgi:thymidylate synthase (FAD)
MIKVLDHGYVKLIETWGSDERIVEAARMSTQKGFEGWGPKHTNECDKRRDETFRHYSGPPQEGIFKCECGGNNPGDEKLLGFLWKNRHTTPFEMAGAIVEVQAPIFVFREWHRHRTQSYNEMSARYAPLPDVNYVPTVERLMLGSDGKNKQAGTVKDAAVLDGWAARDFQAGLRETYARAQALYEQALKMGVPKELARVHLPVGRYSRMRASANLLNWMRFVGLRSDMNPEAQWEIRQYANAVLEILAGVFPRTIELVREKPL